MIYTSSMLILNCPIGNIVENYKETYDFVHMVKPKAEMLKWSDLYQN